MSERSRSEPWFRKPEARYERALTAERRRLSISNADPAEFRLSFLPPMLFFFDSRGQPCIATAAGGCVQ